MRRKIVSVLLCLVMVGTVFAVVVPLNVNSSDMGLVAYWKFDEGSGNTAYDSAGDNDGTIYGASYVNGISGKALDFQGSLNSYVKIPDSDSLDLTGDFTIEEWINVREITNEGAILAKYDSSSSFSYQVGLYNAYGGKFLTGFSPDGSDTGSSVNNVFSTTTPILNRWYYVVSVHDQNELRIYINGQWEATKTNVPLDVFAGDSNIYIGKSGMAHEDYHCIDGIIDEVRIWNRALSDNEIETNYEYNSPLAYWDFNEDSGNIAHDSVGGNDGNLYGNPDWIPGISGCALSFDGNEDYVVDIGTLSTFSFMQNTGVFTLEAWIKLKDYSKVGQQAIIGNQGGSAYKGFYFLYENREGFDNQLRLALFKGISGNSVIISESPVDIITDNDWHYVAATGDGTNVIFYVDGIAYAGSGTMGTKSSGDSTKIVTIGRIPTKTTRYFDGLIDEVKIWNRALSGLEIWDYYSSMLPDLSIISDDILFSDTNPTVGETITIDATVRNEGSETGVDWKQATSAAQWSSRYNHKSVVFNDKIWVIGGATGLHPNYENDTWYSTDGVSWTQATASALWSARYGHTSVVFNNKIWVIGGYDGSQQNDVWYSSDGISWTQATASAPWSARNDHTSVIFDDKIWVIGGTSSFTNKNDVWFSSDGFSWTLATASAPWIGRGGHTSVEYNNKLWVIGGYDESNWKNDTWYSTDGVSWTQSPILAPWSARGYHNSIIFNNKIWVIGGNDGSQKNDVWYSSDGVSWSQATASAQWSGRQDPEPVVFDNKLWIMGGYYYDGGYNWINDVWYSVIQPKTTALLSFYDGDPDSEGILINQDNIMIWGDTSQQASIDWTPTTVGMHDIYVSIEDVDPGDADWSNNIAFKSILVIPIKATIDIDPDTIQLGGKGKWITCYIELPEGYDVRDIDASTILLEEELNPISDLKYDFVTNESAYIVDHNEDGIRERMVKFDRDEVEEMLSPGTYNLKVTGDLIDGRSFEGYSDEIRVINPP